MRGTNSRWEYRRIVALIRGRVDKSSCNTRDIITYMRKEFGHETKPYELEKALVRCERIHRVGSVDLDGEEVTVWISEWDPEFKDNVLLG
ncbi:MAG: hypothetical protein CMB42_04410 [Euryarchaeota archaeon]|mgnify:FL=1|nr:hypothetical protein [Euryarchaeota archaeon]